MKNSLLDNDPDNIEEIEAAYREAIIQLEKQVKNNGLIDQAIFLSLLMNLLSLIPPCITFYPQTKHAIKLLKVFSDGKEYWWQSVVANPCIWPQLLFAYINLSRHVHYLLKDPRYYFKTLSNKKIWLLLSLLSIPGSMLFAAEADAPLFVWFFAAFSAFCTNSGAICLRDNQSELLRLEEKLQNLRHFPEVGGEEFFSENMEEISDLYNLKLYLEDQEETTVNYPLLEKRRIKIALATLCGIGATFQFWMPGIKAGHCLFMLIKTGEFSKAVCFEGIDFSASAYDKVGYGIGMILGSNAALINGFIFYDAFQHLLKNFRCVDPLNTFISGTLTLGALIYLASIVKENPVVKNSSLCTLIEIGLLISVQSGMIFNSLNKGFRYAMERFIVEPKQRIQENKILKSEYANSELRLFTFAKRIFTDLPRKTLYSALSYYPR